MIVGSRLRELRESRKLSQGEMEKRTGLLRCYISRVENGHTVPAIETLERMAKGLDVPLYKLFYEGEAPPIVPAFERGTTSQTPSSDADLDEHLLSRFRHHLSRMDDADRQLFIGLAKKMASRKPGWRGSKTSIHQAKTHRLR
jgi:transcriptional regulator with XRE-family HTH domain